MKSKILIVDDNKMLGKLLAKKIQATLNYEVDVAFDFAQAKELSISDYFLSFIDLCLPDAPNGEAVDFMLEKKCPTIVLTASTDKTTKDNFMDKDILDYICKESDSCVDHIINSIINLKRYEKTKVILAMSKLNERNEIKKYLTQRFFNVLGAAHGEEALNYLEQNSDVKLIICDAKMPVIDGVQLLSRVREQYTSDDLGMIILGDKDDGLEVDMLKNNANDYLIKPINKELFNFCVNRCLVFMDNVKFLNSYSHLDFVSGVKNNDALMEDFENYLNEISSKDEEFAFAFLDIDNLKTINDEYGYNIGNEVIRICAKEITDEIKGKDIVGRYSSEKFCIILKNINQERAIKIFSRIRVNIKNIGVLANLDELFFTASIGIVFANSKSSKKDLIEKAEKTLSLAKSNGKNRVEVCF